MHDQTNSDIIFYLYKIKNDRKYRTSILTSDINKDIEQTYILNIKQLYEIRFISSVPMILASGFAPRRCAACAVISTRAQAPSLRELALPAVTVPAKPRNVKHK